jgi:hypothetical protein
MSLLALYNTHKFLGDARSPHLMSLNRSSTSTSGRIHTEPFQIFAMRQRAELMQQNPNLSNSEIVSLLGRMWRSLPREEKEEYMQLALNVEPTERPPRRGRRPRRRVPPPDEPLPLPDTAAAADTGSRPDPAPEFSIIPRGSSGARAASASHRFLFPDSEPPDAGD